MRYKHYKNANVDISEFALGTWGLDDSRWNGHAKNSEAIEAMKAMIEQGVNLIDTAANYGNGTSEKVVGELLKSIDRSKVFISTKFGTQNDLFSGGVYRDAKFSTVMRELAGSLKNLKTDYVDFYFLHWPDPSTPIAETMCALNFLKQQGKIRFIGLSNCDLPLLQEAMKYGQVDVIQPPFSMIDQRYKETMEWAGQHGVDVMAYGSMGGGILTGKYREIPNWPAHDVRYTFYKGFSEPVFSKVQELLRVMDDIALAHKVPVSQVAINWTCQKDYVSSALIGVTSLRHVKENLDAFEWKLSDEEIKRIDDAIEEQGLDKI